MMNLLTAVERRLGAGGARRHERPAAAARVRPVHGVVRPDGAGRAQPTAAAVRRQELTDLTEHSRTRRL